MAVPAIKNWKVQHDTVVSLHISGYSNKKIAVATGLTEVRVSQVINDPLAKDIIRGVQKSLRMKMEEDIGDKLIVLAEEGAARIGETIEAEFLLGSDQKKHQDNVSIQVLKGTGFLSREFALGETASRPPLDEMLAERLVTALEKSNEAARGGEIISEAIEVPFEVVESDE